MGGARGNLPFGYKLREGKICLAPSDFICFICFDIQICQLLNVEEKYAYIRPRALCFCVLSINEKVTDVFFNYAKREFV